MGLCSGFVLKTVLLTQGYFSDCWSALTQSQGLFCFSPHQQIGQSAQEPGEGTRLGSWPQLTKGIFHATWRHAQHIKLGEGGNGGERLKWQHLSSQVTIMCDGALLSWRWLNSCLPMGSGEWIPYFALLAHAGFTLPVTLSLSQPTSFLTFTLLILSPVPPWGERASGCLVLSCSLGLNHNIWKS